MPQRFPVFYEFGVNRNTRYRADLHTLGLIEMPYTLRAFMGVNFINLLAHKNGIVRTLRLADVTVDAFIGNDQSHQKTFKVSFGIYSGFAPKPRELQIARRRLEASQFL